MSVISNPARGAKPCPFCGSTKIFVERADENSKWSVECYSESCLATGPRDFQEQEEAISAWNDWSEHSGAKESSNWLLTVERFVLTIAGLFALFPLYQFLAEADDRRLDRVANFITAHQTCVALGVDHWSTDELIPPGIDVPTPNGFEVNTRGGGFVLSEETIENNPRFVSSLSRNVQLQCQFIFSVDQSRDFFD